MSQYDFEKVCKISDLKEKKGLKVTVHDIDVAVYLYEGDVYALSNVCPHQQQSKLHKGFFEDEFVACPIHGWAFSVKTGKNEGGGRGIDSYEVKIDNDDVYVKVFEKEMKW